MQTLQEKLAAIQAERAKLEERERELLSSGRTEALQQVRDLCQAYRFTAVELKGLLVKGKPGRKPKVISPIKVGKKRGRKPKQRTNRP